MLKDFKVKCMITRLSSYQLLKICFIYFFFFFFKFFLILLVHTVWSDECLFQPIISIIFCTTFSSFLAFTLRDTFSLGVEGGGVASGVETIGKYIS